MDDRSPIVCIAVRENFHRTVGMAAIIPNPSFAGTSFGLKKYSATGGLLSRKNPGGLCLIRLDGTARDKVTPF
jgi:hypothetical protein